MRTEPASRHALACLLVSAASLAACASSASSEGPPPASPSSSPAGGPTSTADAKPSGAVAPSSPSSPAASPNPTAASPAAQTPPPPPPARATTTDAPMLTRITQDDILAAVNANGEAFNACYAVGAGKSKTFSAKITVKATVGPTGAVNAVEIVNSSAKNPKVDACVQEAFKKLSFKRPEGSGATVFTFPLTYDGAQVQ